MQIEPRTSVAGVSTIRDETYLCSSSVQYVKPVRAINSRGQWRIVLNHLKVKDDFISQPVRIELCHEPGQKCPKVPGEFPIILSKPSEAEGRAELRNRANLASLRFLNPPCVCCKSKLRKFQNLNRHLNTCHICWFFHSIELWIWTFSRFEWKCHNSILHLSECIWTKCVQKHTYQRLVVFNPDDYYLPFAVESFKIPSSCDCYATQSKELQWSNVALWRLNPSLE